MFVWQRLVAKDKWGVGETSIRKLTPWSWARWSGWQWRVEGEQPYYNPDQGWRGQTLGWWEKRQWALLWSRVKITQTWAWVNERTQPAQLIVHKLEESTCSNLSYFWFSRVNLQSWRQWYSKINPSGNMVSPRAKCCTQLSSHCSTNSKRNYMPPKSTNGRFWLYTDIRKPTMWPFLR